MFIAGDVQCPQTGLLLHEVSLQQAGQALGHLEVRPGAPFGLTDQVLLRSDGKAAYPLVNGIPILLAPEAITPVPQAVDLRDERWGEAYDEMQFYSASADEIDDAAVSQLAASLKAIQGPPAYSPDWLDAPYDAAAQLDAIQHLGDVAGRTVLQLGGKGVQAAKALLAGAAHAWLVSPVVSEVEYARRLTEQLGVQDRFHGVVGIAEQIPLRDSLVDSIYMGGCLHHMTVSFAAPEFRRILKVGGKFAAVEPWQTLLHKFGTKAIGKREANAYCRPLTDERLSPLKATFVDLQVRHHGPLLRYLALAIQKLTKRAIRPATGLRLTAIDDRLPLPDRLGGSVAILGGLQ